MGGDVDHIFIPSNFSNRGRFLLLNWNTELTRLAFPLGWMSNGAREGARGDTSSLSGEDREWNRRASMLLIRSGGGPGYQTSTTAS